MSDNGRARQPIDLILHEQNRRRIPHEVLQPYAGQHVAFNAEGTAVVASGPSYEALFAELEKAGISISEVTLDYIPGPDEHTWL
jgi:hypothetical protein